MCQMTADAAKTYPELTTYNIVFGMDRDEYFTAGYIARKLGEYGVDADSGEIEQDLRRWARAGKLARFSGAYAVA